ncbi:hypothetical protein PMI34_05217 [Pseudomonas sp. GM74]|uniref:hypothetical protein n=1 Tax=Pseudomonas sp. GM74 TaxID=1144336 RepID=UPI000270D297|nr:hypothetical protein [Pseudomonas sp. GM74]EJM81312.1 hypothetical protein PMI34_05217 [Pseudomonas sp. GM74]
MPAPNIERFNILVGSIFAKLYESFPVPIELSAIEFADQLVSDDCAKEWSQRDSTVRFFGSTVDWLSDHGYLKRGVVFSNSTILDCVLTARTLELLNAMPSSLENKGPSLGDQLVKATKEGMSGKVKELASDFLSRAVVFGTKAATDWVNS